MLFYHLSNPGITYNVEPIGLAGRINNCCWYSQDLKFITLFDYQVDSAFDITCSVVDLSGSHCYTPKICLDKAVRDG